MKPLRHDSPAKERRALAVSEIEKLFEVSPPRWRSIWRLFMVSGIRRTELIELKFANIDFEQRCLTITAANAKSGKKREIPLDDQSFQEICELQKLAPTRTPSKNPVLAKKFSRDHVFVTEHGTPLRNNLLRSFYACCKRAGIEDAVGNGAVDIHSLRVTYTTLSLENGASPKAVQAILGHSTLTMTMNVYARATDKAKREAVSALPFANATAPKHVIPMPEKSPAANTQSDPQSRAV